MPKGLNRCTFIGNLGADPKWEPDKGQGRCAFSIAVNETWADRQTGEVKERVEWVHVVVWGRAAKACADYLAKGRPVYVDGRWSTTSWEDREGNKRYKTEIVANEVIFLGGGEQSGRHQQQRGQQAPPPEGDIPF